MLGFLARCLNCGLLWRRVTADDNPGGTVSLDVIQHSCPSCFSNAYEPGEVDREAINK